MTGPKTMALNLDGQDDSAGPVRGTQSLIRIALIWLAANLVVTTLLTGTLFVPGVSFGTATGMIVLGTLIGVIVLVLIGNMGTRTGLPTMALTRGAFGIRGSLVPAASNLIVLMGWSWVQAMLAGVTVDFLVFEATGFSNPMLFSAICQGIVVVLAIFGHTGISRVEPWLALVILVVMGFVFAAAFGAFSPGEFAALPVDAELGGTPFITLDLVIATAISWTVLSADMNRHAKNSVAGVVGSGVGYTLSTTIAMFLGLVAFSVVLLRGGEAIAFDPTVIVAEFGWPLGIAIFLSVMATNTMVVFGMVTSVINAQSKWHLRFLPTAIVLGIISIIGSTFLGLLNQFTDFLFIISAFFVPVFAIMIADYYLLKRRSYSRQILQERPESRYWYLGGINWVAVFVWIFGAALSYVLAYVAPSPIGANIPAFAVSFALYLGLTWALRGVKPLGLADPRDAVHAGHLLDEEEEAGDPTRGR
ncbi:purine-cytosine transporter [Pseudoclavibacter sp. RFBI5]|uniref:purine-cytosine permease family protein n=1 Tax=Pseudoclavibacter sp. RFBI5 TaxID=2080578 RepID=UPI000CE7904B|nr:cytosine permease [Pseudoclavibacter sp. RFBI5]PPG02267.1 purine-cytosine transporter [Pseudoclavibacter sp. RFBI5]